MTSDVLQTRQQQELQKNLPVIIAGLGGAVAVGLIWIATAWSASQPVTPEPAVVRSENGDLKVRYMVQDTESSASGSTLESVTAIEFHANYIVVRQRDGRGRVFFNERTRELSWSRADSTP